MSRVLPLANAAHILGENEETAQCLLELRARLFQKHLHFDGGGTGGSTQGQSPCLWYCAWYSVVAVVVVGWSYLAKVTHSKTRHTR